MSEVGKPEACNVRLREDPVEGWKMVIDQLSPACEASLKQISQNLGPHSRRYIAKRIETSNPEVKRTLEEMGLSSG
jgi:hypothetical protein